MVYNTVVGGLPSSSDCRLAAVAAAQWDIDGASPGTSYRLFRSSASRLVRVDARSMDVRSNAAYTLDGFGEDGRGLESVSDPLTASVAPLMHWMCLPGQPSRTGRTYMPCLCHNVLETGMPERINHDVRGPLVLCFNGLITLIAIDLSAIMVVIKSQIAGRSVRPCLVSQVSESRILEPSVGTQRRRIEP